MRASFESIMRRKESAKSANARYVSKRFIVIYNAAMHTVAPKGATPWQERMYPGIKSKRGTSLMVHVAGHGARRVYRSDRGSYYVVVGKARHAVDMGDVLRIAS